MNLNFSHVVVCYAPSEDRVYIHTRKSNPVIRGNLVLSFSTKGCKGLPFVLAHFGECPVMSIDAHNPASTFVDEQKGTSGSLPITMILVVLHSVADTVHCITTLPDPLDPNKFLAPSFNCLSGTAVDYVVANFPGVPMSVLDKRKAV